MAPPNPLLVEIDADSRVCCIIHPPCCGATAGSEAQVKALAEIIWAGSGLASRGETFADLPAWAMRSAQAVWDRLSLAPKGAADHLHAVAELYAPFLGKTAA